jgi:hypothetical protein
MAELQLSQGISDALDGYVFGLRAEIVSRAENIAQQSGQESIGLLHVAQAIDNLLPHSQPLIARRRFFDVIHPITIISALLAIAFAGFGVFATSTAASGGLEGIDGAPYLDIAKIFAGAIVGSATATASSSVVRRRG